MQEQFENIKEEWIKKLALLGLAVKFSPFKEKTFMPCDDHVVCDCGKFWQFERMYVGGDGARLYDDLLEEMLSSLITTAYRSGFSNSKKREGQFVKDDMSILITRSFGLSNFIVGYCECNADN
jgi:hypothetical protein